MAEFKVGDKVVVIETSHFMNLKGVHLGAVAEVVKNPDTFGQALVRFECGSEWWAYSNASVFESFSRFTKYNMFLVKKEGGYTDEVGDDTNPQTTTIESEEALTGLEVDSTLLESELKAEGLSENLPYLGDGKVGDASAEAVAQGYKTIVEKGDLTVYTNLPVEIIGSIIVVGEKDEL